MSTFTKDAVEKLSASLNEPEWMLEFRLKAFEIYESMPMPTTKDEAWRRTDLRKMPLGSFNLPPEGAYNELVAAFVWLAWRFGGRRLCAG